MELDITPKRNNLIVSFNVTSLNYDNIASIKKTVENEVKQGNVNLIIDLSSLEALDSTGLGALVSLNSVIRQKRGSLKLCGMNDMVKKIFQLTKMNIIFPLYDNLEQALESEK